MPMCHPPLRDGKVREKISAFFLLAVCLLKNCFSRIRSQGILRGSLESISTPRLEPRPKPTVTSVLRTQSGCRPRNFCLFPMYSLNWMQQELRALGQSCAFVRGDPSRTQRLTRRSAPSTKFFPGRVLEKPAASPVPAWFGAPLNATVRPVGEPSGLPREGKATKDAIDIDNFLSMLGC